MYRYLLPIFFVLFTAGSAMAQGQIPTIDLGPDTSYCTNSSKNLASNLIDTSYSYQWSTGDTIYSTAVDTTGIYWLQITYDTILEVLTDTGLAMIDTTLILADTVMITINSIPNPLFSTIDNCFATPSYIINNSNYELGSDITYIIGLDTFSTTADTIPYSQLMNGQSSLVLTSIDQPNGCSANDTFVITSLLKPTILLSVDSTCENESPIIEDSSSNTSTTYDVTISENSTWEFTEMTPIQLPPQSSGLHNFSCILMNDNDCSDSMQLPLYIFKILPRDIIGLDTKYCVGAPLVLIHGNFPGGIFSGPYITNLSNGQAQFNPIAVDSNLSINYTYTDSNNCTLSTAQLVDHIYPLPVLGMEGLEIAYCQFDPSSIISVTPSPGQLTGAGLTEISENGAVFTPDMLGLNVLHYNYTDIHGCSNTIIKSAIVNPLPNVELGPSDTLITSGQIIILGPEFIENNVIYSWSTGKSGNTIEISNPGYYILFGTDSITTCESSDTIRVELVNEIDHTSFKFDLKLYPIPFESDLYIESMKPLKSIRMYDASGRPVSLVLNSTDSGYKISIDEYTENLLYLQIEDTTVIPILRSTNF